MNMETSTKEQIIAENTNNTKLNSREDQYTIIHDVENTPFKVIETERGSIVVLGKDRLTEPFEKVEEAIEDAKRMDWERITQVMFSMIHHEKEFRKELENEFNKEV